jgi:hypothetical protein
MAPKKRKAPKTKLKYQAEGKRYLAALDKLHLTVASQQTARLLGIGIRQSMRFARGNAPVSRPVEILLEMYLKHGIDEDA